MEVDTPDSEVGASSLNESSLIKRCTLMYFHSPSLAEQNHNVGNCELVAVVLELQKRPEKQFLLPINPYLPSMKRLVRGLILGLF